MIEQFAPSPQRMYWKLCVAGTTSISFSSFFPVGGVRADRDRAHRDVAGRAGDLGRARERRRRAAGRPSSCGSSCAIWSAICRTWAVSLPLGVPRRPLRRGRRVGLHHDDDEARRRRSRRRARARRRSGRTVCDSAALRARSGASTCRLRLADRLGGLGLDEAGPWASPAGRGRVGHGVAAPFGDGGGCRERLRPSRRSRPRTRAGGQTDSSARSNSGIMMRCAFEQARGARRP